MMNAEQPELRRFYFRKRCLDVYDVISPVDTREAIATPAPGMHPRYWPVMSDANPPMIISVMNHSVLPRVRHRAPTRTIEIRAGSRIMAVGM